MPSSHDAVLARIENLYRMLFAHSGYGEMSVEIRFLRKHEKEVLIKCGKQYRFVVPCDCETGAVCSCQTPEGDGEPGSKKQRGRRASAGTDVRKA